MSSLSSMFNKMFKNKTSTKRGSTKRKARKSKKSKKAKKSKTRRRKQRGG